MGRATRPMAHGSGSAAALEMWPMSNGARRGKAGPPAYWSVAAMAPAAAAQSKSARWCLGLHDGREKRLERKDFF